MNIIRKRKPLNPELFATQARIQGKFSVLHGGAIYVPTIKHVYCTCTHDLMRGHCVDRLPGTTAKPMFGSGCCRSEQLRDIVVPVAAVFAYVVMHPSLLGWILINL